MSNVVEDPTTSQRGTYCVVIQKQLVVQSCPLPKGSCMWKHRIHGRCMYSDTFGTYNEKTGQHEFSANDYAKRVGLPPIEGPLLSLLKSTVLHNIRKDITS